MARANGNNLAGIVRPGTICAAPAECLLRAGFAVIGRDIAAAIDVIRESR